MENIEVWKKVKGYNYYEVSNFGRVRSLNRTNSLGYIERGRIKKTCLNGRGYPHVTLTEKNKTKTKTVHSLVAEAFLNHTPNGGYDLVINHIDFNKKNNRLENLELITNRENCNQKHLKSSSKYTGVCWSSRSRKWKASIVVNKKTIHLGYFVNEYDAHLAYENKLKEIVSTK